MRILTVMCSGVGSRDTCVSKNGIINVQLKEVCVKNDICHFYRGVQSFLLHLCYNKLKFI